MNAGSDLSWMDGHVLAWVGFVLPGRNGITVEIPISIVPDD